MPRAATVLLRTGSAKDVPPPKVLMELYGKVAKQKPSATTSEIKDFIVNGLALSDADDAQAALRTIGDQEPGQRDAVARAFLKNATAANWPYLVRGLQTGNQQLLPQVIQTLRKSPIKPKPEDGASYRQLLLASERLNPKQRWLVVELLRHWTGKSFGADSPEMWKEELTAWSKWFAQSYPKEPPLPNLAADKPSESKWKFAELLAFLDKDPAGKGNPAKGRVIFEKAQCIKCHKFGKEGRGRRPRPDPTSASGSSVPTPWKRCSAPVQDHQRSVSLDHGHDQGRPEPDRPGRPAGRHGHGAAARRQQGHAEEGRHRADDRIAGVGDAGEDARSVDQGRDRRPVRLHGIGPAAAEEMRMEDREGVVMSGKILKDKLIKGERVYGTFFQHAVVPALVDFLPAGVLDFVIVSAEHNALDIADFLPMRYALNAKGIACLARTHSRDPDDVSKVCDSFDGVVVPYVEDVEHAKALAAAAVFRPLKGKALQRVLDKNEWPSKATKDYVTKVRCPDTVFIPMIESVAAVENLDAICSIPGVHAVFVGPERPDGQHGHPQRVRPQGPDRDAEEDHRHRRPAPRRGRLLVRQDRAGPADDPPGRAAGRLLERQLHAQGRHDPGLRRIEEGLA